MNSWPAGHEGKVETWRDAPRGQKFVILCLLQEEWVMFLVINQIRL